MINYNDYRAALEGITPERNGQTQAGSNVVYAICCSTLVLAKHLSDITSAIDKLREEVEKAK